MENNYNEVIYTKLDPNEDILVGDVIMLDIETNTVTRAVANNEEEIILNSRLIVGVCIETNNSTPVPENIEGGNSEESSIEPLDGGSSSNDEGIDIDSGISEQDPRNIIKVAYTGEQLINIYGDIDIGDKVCISKYPGKAKAKSYEDEEYFISNPIGKVVRLTETNTQVYALIDIV